MRNETTDCLRNRRALTTEDEDDGAPSTKPISGGDLKDPRRPRPHAPDRLIEVLSPKRARAVPRSETRQPQGLATPPPGEGGCRHRFESPPDIGLVETTAGTRPSGAEAGVKERAWAVAPVPGVEIGVE